MNVKYKIIIDTDGDISEENTKPFLKKSDFEQLSSDFIELDKFKILLLASFLMTRFLPKYYENYNLKDLIDFSKKIFELKNLDSKLKEFILNNKVFKIILRDKIYNIEFIVEIIKHYFNKTVEFAKEKYNYEYFCIGNLTIYIEIENNKNDEDIIFNILKNELFPKISYEKCKSLTLKIKQKLNKE